MFLADHLSKTEASIIVEDAAQTADKSWYMKGICMQSELQNRNGRVYPRDEIARAVNEASAKLRNGIAIVGEADHPDTLQINIDRISHSIEEIWMEGNNALAKLKILETPMGELVSKLLKAKINLGVSSRGSGDVDRYNRVSDYEFVTVDIVVTPSAPEAYPRSVYESLINMDGGQRLLTMNADDPHTAAGKRELAQRMHKFISEINKI